jgi:hypothetical protein
MIQMDPSYAGVCLKRAATGFLHKYKMISLVLIKITSVRDQ